MPGPNWARRKTCRWGIFLELYARCAARRSVGPDPAGGVTFPSRRYVARLRRLLGMGTDAQLPSCDRWVKSIRRPEAGKHHDEEEGGSEGQSRPEPERCRSAEPVPGPHPLPE